MIVIRYSVQLLSWWVGKKSFAGWRLPTSALNHNAHPEILNIEAGTNIKFMVKLVWKTEEIIGALGKVYADNPPKKTRNSKMVNSFPRRTRRG